MVESANAPLPPGKPLRNDDAPAPPPAPASVYMWMRASLPAVAISLSSMPSLRTRHSSASAEPVEMAILGRLPSLRLRGSRVSVAGSGVVAHCGTLAMVITRRHLPIENTTGMLAPTGTSVSVKSPFSSVAVCATGEPGRVSLQRSHTAPSSGGGNAALGT